MADRPVTLAAIIGAHGVAGDVRLKLFGEGVESLRRYRAFNDSSLTVQKLRDDGKGAPSPALPKSPTARRRKSCAVRR